VNTRHLVPVPAPASTTGRRPARRSSRRPRRSRALALPLVSVEWDSINDRYTAWCRRCTDHYATPQLSDVEDWVSSHRCDAELAGLLTAFERVAA
jgi:hypothetical protein